MSQMIALGQTVFVNCAHCGRHAWRVSVMPGMQKLACPYCEHLTKVEFYVASDGDARGSGYYNRTDDIDYGLLHEEGHQLGLIDIYQLDVPPEANQVSGQGYSSVRDLMHGCSPVISQHSALAMNHWLDKVHGYFGQYLYGIPAQIRLEILGLDRQPLRGATVKMYQCCERPGVGKVITNQIKAQGITDANGEFVLPNVPIDPGTVPPDYAGDVLNANPFGYVAVVGTNGVLHFRVEYNGGVDYAWLDITEANVAYYTGQTASATFVRQLGLRHRGDFDTDGDVDLDDFSAFQTCFNGSNRPYAQTGCEDADFDHDNDVDLGDFAVFQACFNGPNRPPACS